MTAYSEDLRKKIVQALRRGMGKSQAARTFSVSLSSVKLYTKRSPTRGARWSPKRGPAPSPRHGRRRPAAFLEADLAERPSATLSERSEFLERACCGVRVSDSTVSRLLKRMGFTRKKGLWVRANATSS